MKLSHWSKTLGDTVRLYRSVHHELGSPGVTAIPTAGWHNACFGAQNESECEGSLFCPVRWGFLPPFRKTLPLSIYRFRRVSPFEKRIIFCPNSGGLSPASSRNRRNAGVLICELMMPAQARRMLFAVYPRVYAGTMFDRLWQRPGNSARLKLLELCARSHRAWRFRLGSKRRRSVEMQTRPSKKPSAIVRSRPAAALAPRSADMEALLQAPESLRHVPPESPRIQTTAALSLTMDSSATALFYTRKIFAVDPVRLGPRRQAAGAST